MKKSQVKDPKAWQTLICVCYNNVVRYFPVGAVFKVTGKAPSDRYTTKLFLQRLER